MTSGPAIRTILVDDDRALCDEVRRILAPSTVASLVGVFYDAESALAVALSRKIAVDVAVVDVDLPGLSGIEAVRRLAAARPEVHCLMFTVSDHDDGVFRALEAGACGYLLKSTDASRLVERIVEVAGGGAPMSPGIARRVLARFRGPRPPMASDASPVTNLTPRELEVLEMLGRGLTYGMIGRGLGIGTGTVQSHVKAIYRKLEVSSKAEAAVEAHRRGLL